MNSYKRNQKIELKELENLYLNKRISTMNLSKRYGCSQWMIWNLLKKYNIKARTSYDYHAWRAPANQINPRLEYSPALSYVLGVVLGDGWVYSNKHAYFIGLEAQDRKFCESFKAALLKIGLKPSTFKADKYWRTTCSSKLFYNWFNSLTSQQIKLIAKEYPVDFIRGFYESEGCFSRYKSKGYFYTHLSIIISNTDETLIRLAKDILEDLNFHPTLNLQRTQKANWKPCWKLVLGQNKEVTRFLELINPCIKTGENRSRKL